MADGVRALRSRLRADLRVNEDRSSIVTLAILRLTQTVRRGPLAAVGVVLDIVWTQLLMGAQLPRDVLVGESLRLPHGGRGVIVHGRATVGSRVTLYHRVTIGTRHRHDLVPVIGDDVFVGAGASILGAVTVGDGARIGAGAVVVHDVPAGATAVGVPAVVTPAPTTGPGAPDPAP